MNNISSLSVNSKTRILKGFDHTSHNGTVCFNVHMNKGISTLFLKLKAKAVKNIIHFHDIAPFPLSQKQKLKKCIAVIMHM